MDLFTAGGADQAILVSKCTFTDLFGAIISYKNCPLYLYLTHLKTTRVDMPCARVYVSVSGAVVGDGGGGGARSRVKAKPSQAKSPSAVRVPRPTLRDRGGRAARAGSVRRKE